MLPNSKVNTAVSFLHLIISKKEIIFLFTWLFVFTFFLTFAFFFKHTLAPWRKMIQKILPLPWNLSDCRERFWKKKFKNLKLKMSIQNKNPVIKSWQRTLFSTIYCWHEWVFHNRKTQVTLLETWIFRHTKSSRKTFKKLIL